VADELSAAPLSKPMHSDSKKKCKHNRTFSYVGSFLRSRFGRGQTMAEYALILASVAVVVVAGYRTMGTSVTTVLTAVDGKL